MTNWKTTLFGTIAAIAGAAVPATSGKVQTYAQLSAAIAMLLMGIFAKDSNVTGGTKAQ